jgi:DNA-directed RNA polymerase sigma subunit (sigma70/sigma32)
MARYDSVRKIQRNHELWVFTQEHSDFSLREIGDHFKISPERVRQILVNEKKRGSNE